MANINMYKIFMIVIFVLSDFKIVNSTPSTQIWNPSTDIQAYKTTHLGIDNYFSILNNYTKPYSFGTDTGLTYGLAKNVEVGIDVIEPSGNPFYINLKYGTPEGKAPAFAVGVFNAGIKQDITNFNIIYLVAAKTFISAGRLSLGYYSGNGKLLVDENGEIANTGFIASWDKNLSSRIWASVDYASGESFYGNLSMGGAYQFSPNTSVIFGYVIYNNDKININNQVTTQLDINF